MKSNTNLELTLKVILIAIPLTIILTAASTYLALKIGVLTSASIPAAILAMIFLRCFKQYSMLENNLIQTAASAGEAVSGGIVYTIPALIILHYWNGFDYWQNVAIALLGGWLGVLFSIPLRPILLKQDQLRFPEGRAIASVIKLVAAKQVGVKPMLSGMGLGAFFELLQAGFKIISSGFQRFFLIGNSFSSYGFGFGITLVGAGYLMGFRVGLSIFIGAILNNQILLPLMSHHQAAGALNLKDAASFASMNMKFVGLGAMLTAGLITLLSLLKPLYQGMRLGFTALDQSDAKKDISRIMMLVGIVIMSVACGFVVPRLLPEVVLPNAVPHLIFYVGIVLAIIILGFIAAAICGYFSGLVGVSASPGSSILLAALLLSGLAVHLLFPTMDQMLAMVTVVLITSIVTGIACIVNDNIQDLKVGQILGSTPRYQQYMMFMGVLIASLIVPIVMQKLFISYGIGDVLPRPGMDPQQALAAPPAAMLATLTQAVFGSGLPYSYLLTGMTVCLVLWCINLFLPQNYRFSLLSIAMGMYLSFTVGTALFLGALFAKLITYQSKQDAYEHPSMMFACGIVCGAALLDVALAFITAQWGEKALQLGFTVSDNMQLLLALIVMAVIFMVSKKTR